MLTKDKASFTNALRQHSGQWHIKSKEAPKELELTTFDPVKSSDWAAQSGINLSNKKPTQMQTCPQNILCHYKLLISAVPTPQFWFYLSSDLTSVLVLLQFWTHLCGFAWS